MSEELKPVKLMSLAEATAWRESLRAQGKRVVMTNGVFDLLHTGHLYFFEHAQRLGDALVVALNSDESVRRLKGPLRPIQDETQRAYALSACRFVDAAVIFRTERLVAEIEALKPDVYCKAGDYTLETLNPQERAALEAGGAQIKFLPFLKGFSTTGLIAKIKAAGAI